MYDKIDDLIEINLNLLGNKEDNSEFFFDFLNIDGQQFCQIGKFHEAERLAENMQGKDLLTIDQELAVMTEFGYTIFKNGGWKKHLQKEYNRSLNDRLKKGHKENLELTNLNLQKENFEHQKSIRGLENQIRNLTRDNLRLNNWDIRFRWLIAIIAFIIGFITKYFIDK
ncbi:hypothetical protein BFR04_17070 [Gaetbulibacter sp. 4G1]|nr:hypothetical protein [Gaetbulibacter sp. 4G1]PIA80372.1 hypothetical protein BFR04_17070 [Gaetbulibacter sp. 4G1]